MLTSEHHHHDHHHVLFQVQLGSSKVFLNGLNQTEEDEYSQVMNSTIARLLRTKESQMVVTLGSADLASLTRLAETISPLRLAPVFYALLPLTLSSCEDGETENNMVSFTTSSSSLLSYQFSHSVSPHRAGTGATHGPAGSPLSLLLSPGPEPGSAGEQNIEHLLHHAGRHLNSGGSKLSSSPSTD